MSKLVEYIIIPALAVLASQILRAISGYQTQSFLEWQGWVWMGTLLALVWIGVLFGRRESL